MSKLPINVKIFSERPVDLNVIWIIIVILLIILSIFLGFKYSQKCPDVICPAQKDCNLDCTTCPEKIVKEETVREITKYVCQDTKEIVDEPEECFPQIDIATINPIKTNEDNTFIETTSVKPACVSGRAGGEMFYQMAATPDSVVVESKVVGIDSKYQELKSFPGLVEKYRYFTICDEAEAGCKASGAFHLGKHKTYLLRIKFDESSTTGRIEYSNEYVVDTTSNSEYINRDC
ncbi:MAG: hypothetical protein QF824_03845 [Candidatus Woesearchaeota archaeon]|jgi:hypothetical protein|nr:hypothetical protein [Candidatus Woesearchaeota archaeon]